MLIKRLIYKIIDAVKSQASSARAVLCYRTGNIDDISQGTCWKNQAALVYRKEPIIQFQEEEQYKGVKIQIPPPEPSVYIFNECYRYVLCHSWL